jgi:hypothetical protein
MAKPHPSGHQNTEKRIGISQTKILSITQKNKIQNAAIRHQ